MHRIEGTSVDRSSGIGLFKTTPPYTTLTPEWMNSIQEEIMNVITKAGLPVLSQYEDTKDQLWKALVRNSIKYVDDSNYTILDDDGYTVFVFYNLTADRTLNFPTLRDNLTRKFIVYNLTGTYKVINTPEGTDKINDWNFTFEITEKGGRLECLALSTHWECTPNENCCIYEVSSETADTGLTLDGTWSDVSGMVLLNGIYGNGYLDAFVVQYGRDTSLPTSIALRWGIGKISGNNAPNIIDNRYSQVDTNTQDMDRYAIERHVTNFEYTSDGSIIYMKALVLSAESPATTHTCYGDTNCPMYIKWRRTR